MILQEILHGAFVVNVESAHMHIHHHTHHTGFAAIFQVMYGFVSCRLVTSATKLTEHVFTI